MDNLIQKTYNFVIDHHKNDHSGHGIDHIERVYKNACALLETETRANPFVVKMATLLHDVDDPKLKKGDNNATTFLSTLEISAEVKNKIMNTMKRISYTKSGENPIFETVEERLVSDADKLDAMGAIGIIRTIQYSSHVGRDLFDPLLFPNNHPGNLTTINHFFEKLLRLKNALQTKTGKKEGLIRHQTMILFLRAFFKEQQLEEWSKYLNNYLKEQ